MNGAPLPIHAGETQQQDESRLLFAMLETEKAIHEARYDDAVRGLGQLPVIVGSRGRELDPDELRVLNRVTSSLARAVVEVW